MNLYNIYKKSVNNVKSHVIKQNVNNLSIDLEKYFNIRV